MFLTALLIQPERNSVTVHFQALEQETFFWRYCPPTTYKILVYFPEYETFACSEVYHSYAFDSIYTVEAPHFDSGSGSEPLPLTVRRSNPVNRDGWAAAARVTLMQASDLAVALLVGFRAKKQLVLVFGTSFVLHMVQNFLLNYAYMQAGRWAFLGLYFCYGVIVFFAEGAVYGKSLLLLGSEEKTQLPPWGFAAAGSLAACVLGILATGWLQPGIFW